METGDYKSNPIQQGEDRDWAGAAKEALSALSEEQQQQIIVKHLRPPALAAGLEVAPTLKPDMDDVGRVSIGVLTRGRTQCECGRWHHDGLDTNFALAWHQMAMPLNTLVSFIYIAGHKISSARNEMMRLAMKFGSKYLITCDDDMAVPPFLVQHLLQQAKMHPEAGIVSAWSVSKAGPFREPFVYVDDALSGGPWFGIVDEYERLNAKMQTAAEMQQRGEHMSKEQIWDPDRDVRLVEVSAVGTGVMCINLDWVRKFCDPSSEALPDCKHGPGGTPRRFCPNCVENGPWFQEGMQKDEATGGLRTWGQDIWFCSQMQKAGAKVLVNPLLFIPHIDLRTGTVYGPPTKWKTVLAKDIQPWTPPAPAQDGPQVQVAAIGTAPAVPVAPVVSLRSVIGGADDRGVHPEVGD